MIAHNQRSNEHEYEYEYEYNMISEEIKFYNIFANYDDALTGRHQ